MVLHAATWKKNHRFCLLVLVLKSILNKRHRRNKGIFRRTWSIRIHTPDFFCYFIYLGAADRLYLGRTSKQQELSDGSCFQRFISGLWRSLSQIQCSKPEPRFRTVFFVKAATGHDGPAFPHRELCYFDFKSILNDLPPPRGPCVAPFKRWNWFPLPQVDLVTCFDQ